MRKFLLIILLFFYSIPLYSNAHNVPMTGIPHLDTTLYYYNIGVKEKTGHNDGPIIKKFLNTVGLDEGYSWCAAMVSYVLKVSKKCLLTIRTAVAQKFITKKSIKIIDVVQGRAYIPPGTIFIMKDGNTVYGHTGLVYIWEYFHGQTVEGNSGNKVSFLERSYQPRNYQRITHFTLVPYTPEQERKNRMYEPRWYNKTDNETIDINKTR
jgi:hypothetical protein